MTDLLQLTIVEEVMEIFVLSVGAGVALSCIATALSWAVVSVIKLLHKLF